MAYLFPHPQPGSHRRVKRAARVLVVALVLLLILAGPAYLSPYGIVLAFSLCIDITLAQAWNLIGGYGGQFSLAHAMFVGVGSYTAAMLLIHTAAPMGIALLASGLCAGAS